MSTLALLMKELVSHARKHVSSMDVSRCDRPGLIDSACAALATEFDLWDGEGDEGEEERVMEVYPRWLWKVVAGVVSDVDEGITGV